jgi:hypothetical protein
MCSVGNDYLEMKKSPDVTGFFNDGLIYKWEDGGI